MDTKKIFSLRLAQLRKEKGLTQGELADKIGISRQSVTLYERETRVPDIEVLAKLAEFFEVTSDYLIGLEDCRTHEAADISARTGLTDAAVSVLTFEKEQFGVRPLSTEILSGWIEKSFDYLDGEWDDKEDEEKLASPDLTNEEREQLRQEMEQAKRTFEKEKAIGRQCRRGADVLSELLQYYSVCASYNDHFFRVSVHNGTLIEEDFRIQDSPLVFNGKEVVEKVFLDRVLDTIKQGAKEFADEHPEMRRKESAHADEE